MNAHYSGINISEEEKEALFVQDIINKTGVRPCICEQGDPQTGNEQYQEINMYLILIVLPLMATIGIITNILSLVVYTRPCMSIQSVNRYLAALAVSDCGVCVCGIFVITGDSVRSYSPLLNEAYAIILPKALPVTLSIQMITVYLTVMAAVDCFVNVWNPCNSRKDFCRAKSASWVIGVTVFCAFAYNAIVFWELETVSCYNVETSSYELEVCPTHFRLTSNYALIFKFYLYTIFMAFLPFLLLLLLNVLIIGRVFTRPSEEQKGDSTIMLVMVVMLFLCCNSVSLLVNILELAGVSATLKHYLIDAGNFLVVFNSSANFFIYLAFSDSFRYVLSQCCRPNPTAPQGNRQSSLANGTERRNTADDILLGTKHRNMLTHSGSLRGMPSKNRFSRYQPLRLLAYTGTELGCLNTEGSFDPRRAQMCGLGPKDPSFTLADESIQSSC